MNIQQEPEHVGDQQQNCNRGWSSRNTAELTSTMICTRNMQVRALGAALSSSLHFTLKPLHIEAYSFLLMRALGAPSSGMLEPH